MHKSVILVQPGSAKVFRRDVGEPCQVLSRHIPNEPLRRSFIMSTAIVKEYGLLAYLCTALTATKSNACVGSGEVSRCAIQRQRAPVAEGRNKWRSGMTPGSVCASRPFQLSTSKDDALHLSLAHSQHSYLLPFTPPFPPRFSTLTIKNDTKSSSPSDPSVLVPSLPPSPTASPFPRTIPPPPSPPP